MARERVRHTSSAITREELALMLQKYNIGRKPLSKLLGWGETTILLYLNGEDELPENEYTKRLKNLYTHTTGYIALLNSSQGRISDVARRRSLDAIRELFPRTNIFEAAEYVMKLHEVDSVGRIGESMSLLRLETILFWSQVASLFFLDKPIFEEEFMPDRLGLPYRVIGDRLKDLGCIIPEGLFEDDDAYRFSLDEKQLEILEFFTSMFDWYGTTALAELMEGERFRLCGPKTARRRRVVSNDMIKKCYSEVFAQAKIKKLKDIDAYMQKRIIYVRAHHEE